MCDVKNKLFNLAILLLLMVLLPKPGRAGTLVQFQIFAGTSIYLGEADVELYDKDKPKTVQNFVSLIQSGFYVNGFFHRCIPGFVIQGGGYFAFQPTSTNAFYPYGGNLGIINDPVTVTNEIGVGTFYSNTNWTISMAKTSDPNSASSQFFFNLGNNSASLDNPSNSGGFTVFGHVVRGTNVLSYFNSTYGYNYVDANQELVYGTNAYTSAFTTLPNVSGVAAIPFNSLFYYSISVLKASIQLTTNNTRQISWNTVNGVTNNLEYCTNLNSSWLVLTNPLGNGSKFTYLDTTTNNTRRFYRIHPLF